MNARKYLIVLLLAVLAAPAVAQEPTSYRVELVVFQRLKDVGTPEIIVKPEIFADDAAGLPAAAGGQEGVEEDPDGGLGPAPKGAMSVASASVTTLAAASAKLARSAGYRVIFEKAWVQPGLPRESSPPVPLAGDRLAGESRLYRRRYLHLGLDLDFGDDQRLTEWRRMRSSEVHYFDHPLFGAIAVVVPVGNGG